MRLREIASFASGCESTVVDHDPGIGLTAGQLTEASYGEGLSGGVGATTPADGGKTLVIDYSGSALRLALMEHSRLVS